MIILIIAFVFSIFLLCMNLFCVTHFESEKTVKFCFIANTVAFLIGVLCSAVSLIYTYKQPTLSDSVFYFTLTVYLTSLTLTFCVLITSLISDKHFKLRHVFVFALSFFFMIFTFLFLYLTTVFSDLLSTVRGELYIVLTGIGGSFLGSLYPCLDCVRLSKSEKYRNAVKQEIDLLNKSKKERFSAKKERNKLLKK